MSEILPRSTLTESPPHWANRKSTQWLYRQPYLARLLAAVTSVSVRTKIMGIVLVLTISLGLGVTLQVRGVMYTTLLDELDNTGAAVASDLSGRAAGMILDANFYGLDNLLAGTIHNHTDIRYAFILNEQGRVIADTFPGDVPTEIVAVNIPASPDVTSHMHYYNIEGQIHDFAVPILEGRLGTIRVGLAETRLLAIIDRTTGRMLLTTLGVALAGILAALLLTWLLTRPILDLVDTTDQVRRGDLTVRAPHWTDDEIGALSLAFNQMIRELEASQQLVAEKERARTRLLSQLISIQEEERKRIARELHDGVGQALTTILVNLKLLPPPNDPAAQTRLHELRQMVDETLADVRLLSRELRPSALDDLGLAAALERYVAESNVRVPDMTIDLHCDLPARLPSNLETSLYRIIQEAMTNAIRHSGATTLSVLVAQRGDHVQAIIEDNGYGFDVESVRRAGNSVGLHSMTERTELLNGHIEVESTDAGTTVYVELPLTGPLDEEGDAEEDVEEDDEEESEGMAL